MAVKHWQENWEKHVDVLEDDVIGPLYKVVLSRNSGMSISEKIRNFITGPSAISVSKTNQIISLYVSILWVILLHYSLPTFRKNAPINWFYVVIVGLSFATCVSFVRLGKSYGGGYYHIAELRKSRIKPANNPINRTENTSEQN